SSSHTGPSSGAHTSRGLALLPPPWSMPLRMTMARTTRAMATPRATRRRTSESGGPVDVPGGERLELAVARAGHGHDATGLAGDRRLEQVARQAGVAEALVAGLGFEPLPNPLAGPVGAHVGVAGAQLLEDVDELIRAVVRELD